MIAEMNKDIRTIQTGVYQLINTLILWNTLIEIYVIIISKYIFIQSVEKETK